MDTRTKSTFFRLYIIDQLTKEDIKINMHLTERQYATLVQIAKSMDKTDITLDDYLLELNRQYIICEDNKTKIDLLKLIGNIVEKKHKIPQIEKEDKHELGFNSSSDSLRTSTPSF